MPLNKNSIDLEASSSQYAYVADNSDHDITGNLSIECWLNPESRTNEAGLVTKCNNAQQAGIYFALRTNGHIRVVIDQTTDTSTISEAETSGSVSNSVWTHVAFTFNASTGEVNIYFNGTNQALGTDTQNATSINNNNNGLTIGSLDSGTASTYYDGLIDEVRVWNTVRTAQELSDNKDDHIAPDTSGLVAYYRFNGDATDSHANGNNLTLANSPVYSTSVPFPGSTEGGFYYMSV